MEKEMNYQQWIDTYYPTPISARLQCEQATEKMVKDFPNLKRIRGLALVKEPYGLSPTKTPHWWCQDEKNNIVDPTGHQYPTYIIDYQPIDGALGIPSGKCMDCGGIACNNRNFCSDNCEEKYIKYFWEIK